MLECLTKQINRDSFVFPGFKVPDTLDTGVDVDNMMIRCSAYSVLDY